MSKPTTALRGKLTAAADAHRFIMGGNATITARSAKTQARYTFKISAPMDKATGKREDTPKRFVSLLVGSDNSSDFAYLGMIGDDGAFRATRATKAPEGTPFKAFAWIWAQLNGEKLPEALELWHEGKCGRCGRKLTVPESVESGFGPECIHHVVK